MNKHFILEILFVVWCAVAPLLNTFSQDVFRPRPDISGGWSEEIWQKHTGNTWVNTTDNPAQGQHIVYITSGSEITLDTDAGVRYLQIEQGAALVHTNGYHLVIHDLPIDSTHNLEISGTMILEELSPIFESNATGIVHNTGYVQVNGSSNDDDSSDIFAVKNNVDWETGAIFDWNTETPFQMRKGISGANYFYFPNNAINDQVAIFRISKDITVENTGNNGIYGLVEVNARAVIGQGVTGSFDKTFSCGIVGSGALEAGGSGVRFVIDKRGAIIGGRNLTIESKRKISFLTDVLVPKDSVVIITGEGIDNNKTGQILTVNGTLDMTDQSITNTSSTIQITGSGLFRTARDGGFSGSGSSIPSGNVILDDDSTIEFYGGADVPQTINYRNDYKNMIISGIGTKKPASAFSPEGVITIQDEAIFDCFAHNIGNESTGLTMTGGRLILGTNGTQPKMEGVYQLTGGVIEFANINPGITSEQTIRNIPDYQNIEVTGTNVKNSNGNIKINTGGTFTITESGIYTSSSGNASIVGIDGTSRVIVESGGIFKTEVEKGFYGPPGGFGVPSPSVQNSIETIILEPGSTIEYSRGDGQNISVDDALTYQNLTLSGRGEKMMPENAVMHIKGNFIATKNAIFNAGNSTIIFGGEKEQTIASDSDEITFDNLTNNNKVGLSIGQSNFTQDIAVKGILELKEHSKLNMNDADLVLKSTASNTAQVNKIPESATISYPGTGKFRVERYINDHPKAWQLLAVPAFGGTIFESWQNSKDNTPGRGIRITSNTSAPGGSNGFDDYSPGGPSMKYFHSDHGYEGVTSTYELISDHPGYMVFIRGDRNQIGIDPEIHSATTIHTRGKLYEPAAPPPPLMVSSGKFAIMGNPFASAIDFSKLIFKDLVTESNTNLHLNKGYYTWNPQINIPGRDVYYFGQGAFQRVQYVTGYPIMIPSPLGTDAAAAPIQSGQAVFVYNSSSNDESISFGEAAKVAGSSSDYFKPMGNTGQQLPPFIRTNLAANTQEGTFLLDGTLQVFSDEFSPQTDEFDAVKVNNEGENIWFPSDVHPLVVDSRPLPGNSDTVFYGVSNLKSSSYTLQIELSRIYPRATAVFLHDSYSGNVILLDNGENYYDFDVNNAPSSFRQDRFFLTFEVKSLPVSFYFENEIAEYLDGHIHLAWTGCNQESIACYVIEHATDDSRFTAIATVNANLHQNGNYRLAHAQPQEGVNYYRIKAIDTESRLQYSKVIAASVEIASPVIRLYPNPARHILNIELFRLPPGKYHLKIFDNSAKVAYAKQVAHNGTKSTHSVPVSRLSPGVYHVEILGQKGMKEVRKMVVGE